MKKKNYIQPNCDTMVLPKKALMGDPLVLAGSGTMGTVGGGSNPAPKLVPKLGNDSVQVF